MNQWPVARDGGQCNFVSFKYFRFDTVCAEIMPLSLNHRKNRSSVSSVYLACHSAHGEHTVYWKRG
jgi:hypothetical protein